MMETSLEDNEISRLINLKKYSNKSAAFSTFCVALVSWKSDAIIGRQKSRDKIVRYLYGSSDIGFRDVEEEYLS